MRIDENTYRPIREWNESDRPREKLCNLGRAHLSEAELLAIIIGSGTRRESAVELARRLLHSVNNNLVELGKLNVSELQRIPGIGPAKAICITAALELGRRRQEAAPLMRRKVTSSSDLYELFGPRLSDLRHEEFWVVALNQANKVLESRRIGSGGISSTVADIRMILKFGLETGATSLAVLHNHPSGNLNPSEQDIRLTRSISEAARLIEIRLIDHLIVSESGYHSFADSGQLT
ncbi:MAG: DNA repair protein RadC [Bacteroidetes bacterium]|nr:DNA repair protein RadC [Bacteroidota bacterium]